MFSFSTITRTLPATTSSPKGCHVALTIDKQLKMDFFLSTSTQGWLKVGQKEEQRMMLYKQYKF